MIVRGHIDEIRFIDPLARKLDLAGTRRIPEGSSIYLRGWGVLTDPPRAANSAIATIDGSETFELAYNQPRPDVLKALALPNTLPIGFHGVQSLGGLSIGSHELHIALVDAAAGATTRLDTMVAFEIVDGALAFPASQRLPRGELLVNVDTFTTLADGNGTDALENPVARGAVVTIRGWAVDRRYSTAASDVYASIDDTTLVRGVIGTMRADVAGTLGMQTVARCGYVVRFETNALAPGDHRVEVRAIAADGERYAVADPLAFAVV